LVNFGDIFETDHRLNCKRTRVSDSSRLRFDESDFLDKRNGKFGCFPGKLFLSKAERKWRADQEAANKKIANIFNPPSRKGGKATAISVKHQLDIFPPGASCYIMTNEPLSIGTDRDEDYLNSKIESEKGTDPDNPDSDEDGILDGLEVQYGTNPVIRDTDSDGIPDGIEDANQNGRLDYGETDALKRDTDDDNLCDGMCSVRGAKRICDDQNICIDLPYTRLTGEDKNLDGVVDENETDPRLKDTDGDGVFDDSEYYNCILEGGTDC
jgi:hypothetical protein